MSPSYGKALTILWPSSLRVLTQVGWVMIRNARLAGAPIAATGAESDNQS